MRLSKAYDAAVQVRTSAAAAGAPASSAPVVSMTPDKPKYPPYGADLISPDPLAASPPPLVLRPTYELYRVFTKAEIMVLFRKRLPCQGEAACVLCPGFKVWFEKKPAARADDRVVRHEYGIKTGEPYC